MNIYHIQLPEIGNNRISIKPSGEITATLVKNCFADIQDINIPVDKEYHRDRYGFALSGSEIRNFIIHREVLKRFMETNEPWCLIVESNISFQATAGEIINDINELPEDWELFFPYDPREVAENENKTGRDLLNPNVREFREWEPYLMGYQWGNSIYFIHRRGAEKLLSIPVIRQRLDDEILLLTDSGELSTYIGETDWFSCRQMRHVVFADRNQLIWDAICEQSTWTVLRKQRVRDILHVMSETAEELGTDLVLQGGTHLGYVRHGGIMPWDDDVDIGIEANKLKAFLNRLEKIIGICSGEVIEPFTQVPFYKIWNENGEPIEKYRYTFPFVDLWLYDKRGNDLIFKNGIICPGSAAREFEEVIFEGAKFKIPYNSIDILDTRYKDWKKKIRVYSYSHCFERSYFYPLNLDINVDVMGRLLNPDHPTI